MKSYITKHSACFSQSKSPFSNMAFKLPNMSSLKDPLKLHTANLPKFQWSELSDKDEIGRGTIIMPFKECFVHFLRCTCKNHSISTFSRCRTNKGAKETHTVFIIFVLNIKLQWRHPYFPLLVQYSALPIFHFLRNIPHFALRTPHSHFPPDRTRTENVLCRVYTRHVYVR